MSVFPQELMQQNDIAYVLNASNTCPKPDFIPDSHFLRVPVNDSFCEKILPWLDRSVEFIGQTTSSVYASPEFFIFPLQRENTYNDQDAHNFHRYYRSDMIA